MKQFVFILFIILVVLFPDSVFAKDIGHNFLIEINKSTEVKTKPFSDSVRITTVTKGQRIPAIKRVKEFYQVYYGQSIGFVPIRHAAEVFTKEEEEIFSKADKAKQLLVASGKQTNVKLRAYEKIYGKWRKALPEMQGVAGRNGMTKKKKEGDEKSPIGLFALGTAFGSEPKPSNLKMPYRKTTKYDYWIDDPQSPHYNEWVHYRGNPQAKWRSFERMNHELYKYGVVIEYNMNPIMKGKGSAIFLHVWRNPHHPTAGCIAISQTNMKTILTWLDNSKYPHIIIIAENKKNSKKYI